MLAPVPLVPVLAPVLLVPAWVLAPVQSSAKMLPSGAFLDGQKVMRAKIIKHVDIDGSLTSTKPLPGVHIALTAV